MAAKPTLMALLLLGVSSCREVTKEETKQTIATTDSSSVTQTVVNEPDSTEMLEKLQAYAYDSSVYDAYLPTEVKNYLAADLKDWELPPPGEWDNLWFQSYKSPNSLVNFISGDFNCDGQKDYALLLSNKTDSSIAAWVIHSDKGRFSSTKLSDYSKPENHIQLGLELIEAGELNYIDPNTDDPKPIKLTCQAVQVSYFETAAETYYWDNGQYRSVQTGD